MSKTSHPYFIENDPDRKTTATLLVGTAAEFGIDQSDIQVTRGGFNVTEAVAKAIYGDDFDDTEDEPADETPVVTPAPGQPVVTGTPAGGDLTTAAPIAGSDDPADAAAQVDYSTWEYSDLKSAVSLRGLDVENQRGETLAAALTADDAAQANADDTL